MKKQILLLSFCLLAFTGESFAQKFWDCKKGKIDFFSKTPVEDIEAHTAAAGAIINTENGSIAFQVTIKNFKFPNSLMEEHFNENYMESEKYPLATFSGKIEPFVDFNKPGTYNVKAKGKLKIHGVEVEREISGTIVVSANKTAELSADFEVPLADHKIEKPSLVFAKIADKIAVKINFILSPKV
jgi:hypothetical protein